MKKSKAEVTHQQQLFHRLAANAKNARSAASAAAMPPSRKVLRGFLADHNFINKPSSIMAIPLAPEDLLDIIQTLKKQETSDYRVLDYLNPNAPLPHDDDRACRMCRPAAAATRTEHSASDAESSLAYSTSTGSSSHSGVNEDWRSKIVEWSYQVIDHLDYDREIVAVALHYLDRYLCRRSVDKRTFQLVSMTCLHTACKIYSLRRQQLSTASLMQLSRGYFTEDQIFATERSILAYVWRLNWIRSFSTLCLSRKLHLYSHNTYYPLLCRAIYLQ